jgi:peptidylprolyl isomerase
MPQAQRPTFEVMDTNSPTFAQLLRLKANRKDDFFERPAGGIDLCAVNPPVRKKN